MLFYLVRHKLGGIIMLKFHDNNIILNNYLWGFYFNSLCHFDELYCRFAPTEVARIHHVRDARLSDSGVVTIGICGELADIDSRNVWFFWNGITTIISTLCGWSCSNRIKYVLIWTTESLRQKMSCAFHIPASRYYAVDSFPLAVCKFGKVHYCYSFHGYGADYRKCFSKNYFGYKVYALVVPEGYVATFEIIAVSVDDRGGLRDAVEGKQICDLRR